MAGLKENRIKCEACDYETDILTFGTGKYAEKMVCGRCESQNYREQLLRVENADLKKRNKELGEALYEMVEWLDNGSWYGHEVPLIQKSIEAMAAVGFDVIRFECNIENGKQALKKSCLEVE